MVSWIHMNGPENAPLEHAGEATPIEIQEELQGMVTSHHEHDALAEVEKNASHLGVKAAGPHVPIGNGGSIDERQFDKPQHENVYDISKYRRIFDARALEGKVKKDAA